MWTHNRTSTFWCLTWHELHSAWTQLRRALCFHHIGCSRGRQLQLFGGQNESGSFFCASSIAPSAFLWNSLNRCGGGDSVIYSSFTNLAKLLQEKDSYGSETCMELYRQVSHWFLFKEEGVKYWVSRGTTKLYWLQGWDGWSSCIDPLFPFSVGNFSISDSLYCNLSFLLLTIHSVLSGAPTFTYLCTCHNLWAHETFRFVVNCFWSAPGFRLTCKINMCVFYLCTRMNWNLK